MKKCKSSDFEKLIDDIKEMSFADENSIDVYYKSIIRRLNKIEKSIVKALKAANPNHYPWYCEHFKKLSDIVKFERIVKPTPKPEKQNKNGNK